MSFNWEVKKLGDILTLQRGHDLPSQERTFGPVPIMGSSGITGYHDQYKAKGPGVIVGRSGNSMGQVSYISKDYWPLNTSLYVTDFKGNCPEFIYYFLKQINFDQFNSGSAQKSLNRNAVYPYEVKFPSSYKTQSAIASILLSLEQKIEVNQKTNQTLEQMAQALFKSWFVDFEPVKAKIAVLETGGSQDESTLAAMTEISGKDADSLVVFEQEHPEQYADLKATAELFPSAMQESDLGDIPEGWTLNHLGNCVDIYNGFAFKSSDYTPDGIFVLRTRNFNSDHYVERLGDDVYLPKSFLTEYARYICEPYDYHMVMVGASLGHSAIIYPHTLPAFRNQNMWCFRPMDKSVVGRAYVKMMLDDTIESLKGFASGSAREFFRKGDFEKKSIISATKAIHNMFEKLCFTFIEKQGSLIAQSVHLTQLRDTLLPKLLSGEITLPEAEQTVSEAENV